jgi:hypothetical protein
VSKDLGVEQGLKKGSGCRCLPREAAHPCCQQPSPNHRRPSQHRTKYHPPTHLVAHVEQGAQGEAEGEALVVAHKVANILEQEVAGAVEICSRGGGLSRGGCGGGC